MRREEGGQHDANASSRPVPAPSHARRQVTFRSAFENVDEMYLSPASARLALELSIPGGKEGRSAEVAEHMLAAARRGAERFYRDQVSHEWYEYQDRLEGLMKRFKPPDFSPPPVPAEGEPSETWKSAEELKAFAQRFYEMIGATLAARKRMQEKFGPVIDKTFYENPRDGAKVSVVLELYRDSVDHQYDVPSAVELALVAVAIGLDEPMHGTGDPDGGDNRRARWQQTQNKARRLISQELGPEVFAPRGR